MGECVESAASRMKQQTEDILAATKVVYMRECMCAVKPHCVRTFVSVYRLLATITTACIRYIGWAGPSVGLSIFLIWLCCRSLQTKLSKVQAKALM